MRPNQEDLPTPGSHEALAIGCTCPVIDNNHGDGIIYTKLRKFWYNNNCPVHSPKEKENDTG